jgi:hypothetical protein
MHVMLTTHWSWLWRRRLQTESISQSDDYLCTYRSTHYSQGFVQNVCMSASLAWHVTSCAIGYLPAAVPKKHTMHKSYGKSTCQAQKHMPRILWTTHWSWLWRRRLQTKSISQLKSEGQNPQSAAHDAMQSFHDVSALIEFRPRASVDKWVCELMDTWRASITHCSG